MGPADIHRAELADDASEDPPTRENRPPADAPTRELPAAPAVASEDRCTSCGAPMAHDQRYCLECGERRGPSRLPAAQPTTEVRTQRRRSVRAAATPSRVSSGTTLVAGIGVLLLAIGLGVLIGSLARPKTSTQAAAPPQVITVQGGGSGVAASTPKTTPRTVHVTKKAQAKLNAAAAATAPPSAAVQKKAVQAAGKVLGNSKNLAPPTVTTGGKCSSGQAGCQGGQFTGNFFGP